MEHQTPPEEKYNLPKDFYEYIKVYIEGHRQIETPDELIELWQKALDAAEHHPAQRESIAENTLSIGSHTPLIEDDDIFQALHLSFGSLEIADSYSGATKEKAEKEWEKQRKLFNTLLKEYRR